MESYHDQFWKEHEPAWGCYVSTSLLAVASDCVAAYVPAVRVGGYWLVPAWVYELLARCDTAQSQVVVHALVRALARLGPRGTAALFAVGGHAAVLTFAEGD